MPLSEFAPLALEKAIVGALVVFTAAGLLGLVVGQLQKRVKTSSTTSWIFFTVALAATLLVCGFFHVSERLAPYLQPHMGFVAAISVLANAAIWTVCLYSLFGGKRARS